MAESVTAEVKDKDFAETPNESQESAEKVPETESRNTSGADPKWNTANQQIKYLQSLIDKVLHSNQNPWDSDSMEKLIKECQASGDQTMVRNAFEQYLAKFPTNSRMWIQWVEYERDLGNYDMLETVFGKCLRLVPDVELYRHYLDYIKHVHSPLPDASLDDVTKSRETIIQAYEFVTSVVGTDKESGSLWLEFIHFLKEGESTSNYQEQQTMDHLRRVFHKAIYTPLHNIETIWQEYDTFENELSKLTAKKFISDRAAGYMTARGAMKDLKSLMEPIEKVRNWVAKPPTFNSQQIHLLNCWKRLIAWETSDPCHYEDKIMLKNRVMYTYKSALRMLRFFPEIWYDASEFLCKIGFPDEGIELLRQGLVDNPTSLLLAFTLAEKLEAKKAEFSTIKLIFDNLIENLETLIKETNISFDKERVSLLAYLADSNIRDNTGEDEGERREQEREQKKENEKEVEIRVEGKRAIRLLEIKESLTLVWIVYMRITRRSDSDGVNNARRIFSRARKTSMKQGYLTNHIFIASAFMEYFTNKEPTIAGKVFEAGLKEFPLNIDPQAANYVLRYIDYFMCLNDENNIRALFERALAAIPADKSKAIWAKYIEYESQYGDISNLHRIENRMNEKFCVDEINTIEHCENLGSKWKYYDLNSVATLELGVNHLRASVRLPPPAVQQKIGSTLSNSDRQNSRNKPVAMLTGVDVDKFPRPDPGRWNAYRPEPGHAKVAEVVYIGQQTQKPSANGIAILDNPNLSLMVAEPIAKLVAMLPKRESYDGAKVNVPELIAFLITAPIPLPFAAPVNVPLYGQPLRDNRKRRIDEAPVDPRKMNRMD